MKRIAVILTMVIVAIGSFGQIITRVGDTYYVDNQMMKKNAFAIHMQENAEANLSAQFKEGLTLSNQGWILFGCGLGAEVIGSTIAVAYTMPYIVGEVATPYVKPYAAQLSSSALTGYCIGITMAIAGNCCTIAGIVCLGVGYSRMHQSADTYAYMHNHPKDQAYLTLQTSRDGIGLALHF